MTDLLSGSFSEEFQKIEEVRARVEQELLRIEGVVAVSTGYGEDGKPCLKIGTSVPVAEVQGKLPEELADVPVVLEFFGDVVIQ